MPTTILNEDFSGYSPGDALHDPPWKSFNFTARVTGSGFRGNGLVLNGAIVCHIDRANNYNDFTFYYYFKFPNQGFYSASFFECYNSDPTVDVDAHPIQFFKLGFEPDGSISAFTALGKFLGNSNVNAGVSLYSGKWYFLQINLGFDTLFDGTLTIDAAVALDGVTIISTGGPEPTAFNVTNTFNGAATVNRFQFSDMTSFSLLDEIVSFFPRDTFPNYPAEDANRHGRITQGIVEHAQLPDDSRVRMSQGIIDVAMLPDDSKVRITQMIIEIAANNIINPTNGWRVKEA